MGRGLVTLMAAASEAGGPPSDTPEQPHKRPTPPLGGEGILQTLRSSCAGGRWRPTLLREAGPGRIGACPPPARWPMPEEAEETVEAREEARSGNAGGGWRIRKQRLRDGRSVGDRRYERDGSPRKCGD